MAGRTEPAGDRAQLQMGDKSKAGWMSSLKDTRTPSRDEVMQVVLKFSERNDFETLGKTSYYTENKKRKDN